MAPVPIFGIILDILIQLGILVGLFLLFKLACKLSVLTSICLAFLIMPLPALLGIRLFHIGGMFYFGKITWMGILFLAAVCGLILIIQFFRWVAKSDPNTGGVVTSEERQKTLSMVEEGKISTSEASELLEALGRSSAMRGQDSFSRLDMMTLAGIGLVVLGFFLPWVYIDNARAYINPNASAYLNMHGAYQAGYHAGAIGWAVLITAVLATLPVFITPKDYLYKMSMLQMFLLILGAVITISLLVQANRMGAGLWFCLGGYVVSAIASFMKFKTLAA